MAFSSLFARRSESKSKHGRSDHPSKTPTRPRKEKEAEGGEKQPDVDALRRQRIAYYSISPEQRKKISSAKTTVKPRSHRHTSVSSQNAPTNTKTHTRKHKDTSRSGGDGKAVSDGQTTSEDYVYGPKHSDVIGSESIQSEVDNDVNDGMRANRRHSRHSSSSHRRSLPAVIESEVTPKRTSRIAYRSPPASQLVKAQVRPSLRRSSTTSSKLRSVPESPQDTPSVVKSSRSGKRDSSTLGSLQRRHSTAAVPAPPHLVECLTCGSDDIPSTQSAKLACGHCMCDDCLKRVFNLSVKDPAHMPPKCCTNEHIPLKHVDKLFDVKFKMLWNRKYQEYNTKNRIYCPNAKCGEWIKPSQVHTVEGRKHALCPSCKTKVCTICNNKLHKSLDCPKDPEIAKLVEQAKDEGWQRCFSCSALVELKEGCNHMTCRCKAEFCMICGAKWKTCDCPWFNYNNLQRNGDRLNDMRVPDPLQLLFPHFFGAQEAAGQAPPPARLPRPAVVPAPAPQARNGSGSRMTFQQEIEHRRRQEESDERLARRLQLSSLFEPVDDDVRRPAAQPQVREDTGLGNHFGHFMNDDFEVMGTFGDARLGRRGDLQSNRRRRGRGGDQNEDDVELEHDFVGETLWTRG